MEESEDTLGRLEPGEDLAFHNIPSILNFIYLQCVFVCFWLLFVLAAIQGAVN